MFVPSCLRGCVVTSLLLLLVLSQIDTSSSRSISLGDDYWGSKRLPSKRNSWWSKKSLDQDPTYSKLLPDIQQPEISMKLADDPDFGPAPASDSISLLYGCYISTCVPNFVQCAERSLSHSRKRYGRLTTSFNNCRREHLICANDCREGAV